MRGQVQQKTGHLGQKGQGEQDGQMDGLGREQSQGLALFAASSTRLKNMRRVRASGASASVSSSARRTVISRRGVRWSAFMRGGHN